MGDFSWEHIYSEGKHNNRWPWSDLVSLFFRYQEILNPTTSPAPQTRLRVLELGSGTGNNIAFWKSVGADYFAIEQSPTAVRKALEKFPDLQDNIAVGDFSDFAFSDKEFDIVCDRAAVTHGSTREISETIGAANKALRKGGLFFGVDWFSMNHSDYLLPTAVIDQHTKSDFASGQFVGVGKVHFSDREHLLQLFKDFLILELDEKVITRHYPEIDEHHFASWNVVARKPQ